MTHADLECARRLVAKPNSRNAGGSRAVCTLRRAASLPPARCLPNDEPAADWNTSCPSQRSRGGGGGCFLASPAPPARLCAAQPSNTGPVAQPVPPSTTDASSASMATATTRALHMIGLPIAHLLPAAYWANQRSAGKQGTCPASSMPALTILFLFTSGDGHLTAYDRLPSGTRQASPRRAHCAEALHWNHLETFEAPPAPLAAAGAPVRPAGSRCAAIRFDGCASTRFAGSRCPARASHGRHADAGAWCAGDARRQGHGARRARRASQRPGPGRARRRCVVDWLDRQADDRGRDRQTR